MDRTTKAHELIQMARRILAEPTAKEADWADAIDALEQAESAAKEALRLLAIAKKNVKPGEIKDRIGNVVDGIKIQATAIRYALNALNRPSTKLNALNRPSTKQASGYEPCGCRDCMELAMGEPGDMCHDCQDAGCEPGHECQAPGAYGVESKD